MISDSRAKWEPGDDRYWESTGKPEKLTLLRTRGGVLLLCRPSTLAKCGYSLLSGRANVNR